MTHVLHCPLSVGPGDVLGYRKDGRPIHPIAGAEDNPPAPPAPPAPPVADPPAPPAPPAAPPAPAPPAPPAGQEVKDLPDWAQKIIKDTRDEAAASRTAARSAGDAAQADLLTKMQVALGLKPDPAADPVALAEKLATEQAKAKTSAIKLAVHQGAGKHQGDPAALLDSNSFMSTVSALDPDANDFSTKVDEAIKAAVAANTKLKLGQAPGVSGGQFTGGPGGTGTRPTSLGAAVGAAYKS